MSKNIEEGLKAVCDGIISNTRKELSELSQEGLERYWFYKHDPNKPKYIRYYEFWDMLNLYEHHCRRWEEIHNGSGLVVERVRDTYLLPKIKEFIEQENA